MRLNELKKTEWYGRLCAECAHDNITLRKAVSCALDKSQRFDIYRSNARDSKVYEWVIVVQSNPSFMMDLKPTLKEATAHCGRMGWKIGKVYKNTK